MTKTSTVAYTRAEAYRWIIDFETYLLKKKKLAIISVIYVKFIHMDMF